MADPEIIPIPPRVKDLAGLKFGRLTVLGYAGKGKRGSDYVCRCDCGAVVRAHGASLSIGNTKSCGCLRHETQQANIAIRPARQPAERHGLSRTTENVIWRGIKQRCCNPQNHAYARYGGRGIMMCQRWQDDFENFLADMGARPSMDHSIDRIDNDGNYEPGNCRWATAREQSLNTRRNKRREV